MKKISIILVLAMILSFALISCGDKKENDAEWKTSDYSPASKVEALTALPALADTSVFTANDNPIDDDFDYYFGDATLMDGIEEYVFFTSKKASVAEAGIFKCKDKKTAEALLKSFAERRENLSETFKLYSPEDTNIALNMKTGSFDDIVWFAATNDNQSVADIITK